MILLQQILYSVFGILTLIGFFQWFTDLLNFYMLLKLEQRGSFRLKDDILFIGLLGLLYTYIWT
jgi:hypothetical protein